MRKAILFCLVSLINNPFNGWGQQIVSPILYTLPGATYFQNFDGLPITGSYTLQGKGPFNLSTTPINGNNLNGWQFLQIGGTGANGSFLASTGSSTGSGAISLGGSNQSDRALGTLASGSGIYGIGLILTNQTGISLNSITISFTVEQWRKGGSTNKNSWSFKYKTGSFNNIDYTDYIL